MAATYRDVSVGYWPDLVIGALLLSVWVVMTAGSIRNWLRNRRGSPRPVTAANRTSSEPISEPDVPYERCKGLIAEALIVRDRVSGQIDAATYQERMKELVSRGRS